MRITKVYTKTGDKGKTRLAGGQQVWKDSLRVEAYGAVDELNGVIGLIREMREKESVGDLIQGELRWIQHKLFDIGGLLATAPGQSFKNMPRIFPADVGRLERVIDACQEDLPPLKEFILPGGGIVGGLFHVARTVCRRAERRCVGLMRREAVDSRIVIYLNRLSDMLFVVARWVAKQEGKTEVCWQRDGIQGRQLKTRKPSRRGKSSAS